MVNTVVTFENTRRSSVTPLPVVVKPNSHSTLQRRLYLTIGILVLIIILLPTLLSIEKDQDDFAFHLLFIVHISFLLLFFISTTIYRNIGDGITTIPSLVLLAIYITIHYVIRHRYCRMSFRTDFLIATIQLTVILVFVVTYVLWTYLLIRKKNRKKKMKKMTDVQTQQKRIFLSFLALNLMLMISSVILNIRSRATFGLYEIIFLSVGLPFALLWATVGVLVVIFQNCLCITTFYFLSIIQPFHLIHLIIQSVNELQGLATEHEVYTSLPLLIITFVCAGTDFLVHLLTTIAACWMISRTDERIFNTRWMLTGH